MQSTPQLSATRQVRKDTNLDFRYAMCRLIRWLDECCECHRIFFVREERPPLCREARQKPKHRRFRGSCRGGILFEQQLVHIIPVVVCSICRLMGYEEDA